MKRSTVFYFMLIGFSCQAFLLVNFPQAEISNGMVKAKLLLPDAKTGYYQATRFDWSGLIESLEYKGHSYFGQWFKTYDPKVHDAVTGPVEEFNPIGYDDAKAGDSFLKIGVGTLLKPDDKPYSSFILYEIANPGKWTVKKQNDQVEFRHELKDVSGFSYVYSKTVRLIKGKPQLVLEHSLKNSGNKVIETNVYDHNFFVIDKQPTGTAIKIKFPFEVSGTGKGIGTLAVVNGKEINYLQDLIDKEIVYIPTLLGFGKEHKDYDFRIENHKSGAGVRIMSDQPIERMAFWSSSTTYCPEPYIHIKVDPGKEYKWEIRYYFYEIPIE